MHRAGLRDALPEEIEMKSDEALKHDVEQELLWDSAVDARNVTVTVHGRVVTLEGFELCAETRRAESHAACG
jgi:osmotically-inducible protein OsmY